jgi:hypothetical protein
MVAALRETVTVSADGRIEVRSAQFRPGTRVEVIVLEEESGDDAAWERIIADPRPRPKLDAFIAAAMAEGGEEELDPSKM